MHSASKLVQVLLLASLLFVVAAAQSASTFAGSTSTAVFPPPNATVTATDTFFPDGSQVGFAGPTPSLSIYSTLRAVFDLLDILAGDEAEAIATAPSNSKVDSVYPLVRPAAADKPSKAFDLLQHLANLAPWQSVHSFGLPSSSPLIPDGCNLHQVHLLHRHGARYPTSGSGPAQFAATLHAAANGAGFSASGSLKFLNTWTYKLGAEILTPFGRSQLYVVMFFFSFLHADETDSTWEWGFGSSMVSRCYSTRPDQSRD